MWDIYTLPGFAKAAKADTWLLERPLKQPSVALETSGRLYKYNLSSRGSVLVVDFFRVTAYVL